MGTEKTEKGVHRPSAVVLRRFADSLRAKAKRLEEKAASVVIRADEADELAQYLEDVPMDRRPSATLTHILEDWTARLGMQ